MEKVCVCVRVKQRGWWMDWWRGKEASEQNGVGGVWGEFVGWQGVS